MGVAAIHSERVEFQQFPAVVFVGFFLFRGAAVHPAIKIPEHGWAQGRGFHEVPEFSKGMGPDHGFVVGRFEPLGVALGRINVEMIRPEIDHDFLQLPAGVHRTQDFGAGHLVQQFPRIIFQEFAQRPDVEGLEVAGAGFCPTVIDGFGSQLAVDPRFAAQFQYLPMVAGTGAEGDAVQEMGGFINLIGLRGAEGGESVARSGEDWSQHMGQSAEARHAGHGPARGSGLEEAASGGAHEGTWPGKVERAGAEDRIGSVWGREGGLAALRRAAQVSRLAPRPLARMSGIARI